MTDLEPILAHALPFLLVASRLAGLFLFAPVLASPAIPPQAKALLVITLAASVYPTISGRLGVALPPDLFSLLPMLATEALLGAAVGLVAAIPLAALEMAGFLSSHQMGFALAVVYNPAADTESDVLGQLVFYTGLATFIGIGGLDATFAAIISTYDHLPIGLFAPGHAPLDLLLGAVASGFELALRVAAPVMCLVFLQLLAMGVLMKTMPQMNVLTYGFALKILTGLGMLALSLGVVGEVAGEEITRTVQDLMDWAAGLRP